MPSFLKEKLWRAITDRRNFASSNVERFEKLLSSKKEEYWIEKGEENAIQIFHEAAERIPAYKLFLKAHAVSHAKIKTVQDFRGIPYTDKKNYIQAYSLKERCWDGNLYSLKLVAMSSGTTGTPTFWPRGTHQEYEAAFVHELLFRFVLGVGKKRGLIVIGFPMGVYVSGIAEALSTWLSIQGDTHITMITVGNSKAEFLRVIENLGSSYEQVILAGHPFFLKDVIETGLEQGVKWGNINLRMVMSSEGFSEKWRDYLGEKAGLKGKPDRIISTYGSSEMLLVAHETPLSISLRRLSGKHAALSRLLGAQIAAPSIFQFHPIFRYIESVNTELVFTSLSGVPLVRYNLHDSGQVISGESMRETLGAAFPEKSNAWNLPFVTLTGRSDQTIIFYAANIYPEQIRIGLDHPRLMKKLTGRFVMRKVYNKKMDELLEIHVETRNKANSNRKLAAFIEDHIVGSLRRVNMEYNFLCDHLDKDIRPRVVIWPYQHETYFKPGLKPRYILP